MAFTQNELNFPLTRKWEESLSVKDGYAIINYRKLRIQSLDGDELPNLYYGHGDTFSRPSAVVKRVEHNSTIVLVNI